MSIDFDHVAIALNDVRPTMDVLVGELGAQVLFGGPSPGFRAVQLQCCGMMIELLEPWETQLNDFLERFLRRSGEGPHHLTFKTDDIGRELDAVGRAGYNPVNVNLDNPWWMEAFLHPSEAGGTVVQIAQSAFERTDLDPEVAQYGIDQWWPELPSPAPRTAVLRRVVVTTDEVSRSLELYRDLLDGTPVDHGEGWTELEWPGGGHVRVELAAGRREGIDRLEWTHSGGHTERTVGGTRFVLYPENR